MKENEFLSATISEFRYYKTMAERAFGQVSEGQLHIALDENTNSVAVIMKHMAGNLISRWTDFLTSDGEKPDRDRDSEFVDDVPDRATLVARWEKGWALVFSTLEALSEADLRRTIYVRSEPLSVYKAIQRQLAHAAYHVGQIVMLCRHHAGGKWETLTIARGGSQQFLEKMREKFAKK